MTLPSGPEWNFLVLLVVIATGPFVAERLRLPGIIGLLIGGFLISGHGLGLLTSEAFVEVVGELGLLYLMFLAGAELDLGLFERLRRKAVVFGLLTFALPFILGLILALWLEFEPLAAILIGSLWASHTLVTYPIIRRFGLTSDPAVASASERRSSPIRSPSSSSPSSRRPRRRARSGWRRSSASVSGWRSSRSPRSSSCRGSPAGSSPASG